MGSGCLWGSTVGPGGVLQGWEAETSRVGYASTPCQPGSTGWLCLTQPLCLLEGSTVSLAEMAGDNLGSTGTQQLCGARMCLSWGTWISWGFGSRGSEAGSVSVSVCVCVYL